jgi:uncharacterized protein (TIGR00369 family)
MPSRSFDWQPTVAAPPGTGLDFLRAMLAGTIPPAPIQQALDFALIAAEPGVATFRGHPAEYHDNPMGTVHGGFAATLLDSAMGSAVMSTLDDTELYVTVDLHVHLVRPMTAASGALTATGRIIHRGKRIATAEGRLTDARDKLVAHATTTCAIAPRGPA